ncbi:hypothetical protein BKA82DRAFT_4330899 [Pisolithus tinctorius]|nr:hypothetical protein BKA82DRAFT_4330899 [Pisolithus tinctorius]
MNISPLARQPFQEAWPLQHLIYERSIALGMTLHPNTQRTYSSHLNSYLTFCEIHDTLSFFVPHSVENYLSDVRDIRNSNLVRRTLRGSLCRFARPYDDLCWLAMLFCGFFGLLCVGELIWPDAVGLRDYTCLSPRSSVSIDQSSFTFCVPQRKSDVRGATSLAATGVPPSQIQAIGGWSSSA